MLEVGRRTRNQPAPPWVVFAALLSPDGDPARPWLALAEDEQLPRVLEATEPSLVVWSSPWPYRPDAVLRFDLGASGPGTLLTWSLHVQEPEPEPSLLGHLRKRVNVLVNAELRSSFGQ